MDFYPLNIIYPPHSAEVKDQLLGLVSRFGHVSQEDLYRVLFAVVLWFVCLVYISSNGRHAAIEKYMRESHPRDWWFHPVNLWNSYNNKN